MFTALALAHTFATADVQVTVTHIDRTVVRAGRRGDRVTETWQIQVPGGQATVVFSPYHTGMAGTPMRFNEGDKATFKRRGVSDWNGKTVHLSMSDVRH